ncbi:MAG: HipA domain-containing protein [Desulfovibrionaceae bacterium]|nr:HipA domain-containing protein [Desulfovibrionaceae bacterium]
MPTELNVFLFDKKVGKLRMPDAKRPLKIFFSYDSNYNGPSLSLSLPPLRKEFDEDISYAFFENLLPERGLLSEITKQCRISSHDLMGYLELFGRETAGAIVVTDSKNIPINDGEYRDVTHIIENYSVRNTVPLVISTKARLTLAGAQDKLAVSIKNGRVLVPQGYSPTTHILKPDSLHFPNIVYNEAFCLDVAERLGIATVEHAILFFNEKPYLALKRYDRVIENGYIRRLHQEDFCQAMGIFGSAKYQRSGIYAGIYDIADTARHAGINVEKRLIDYILFNIIIGNNDAHAKNFSLLYDSNGTTSLAPLYDTICTEVYPELDNEMAMSIGRHFYRNELLLSDIKLLAEDIGISCEYTYDRIVILSQNFLQACTEAIKEYPPDTAEYILSPILNIAKTHISQIINLVDSFRNDD